MQKAKFSSLAIFLMHCLMTSIATPKTNISNDQSSLLSLKAQLNLDPSHILWNNWLNSTPVCVWIGVTCGHRHHRVIALDISRMSLTGSIPSQLGNLSFLTSVNLSSNHFYGGLPQELIKLQRLQIIDLRFNSFSGQIPSWFGFFTKLKFLNLRNNSFVGVIPPSLFNLSNLETLDLSYNPLEGKIPKEIGKLYNLKDLKLQFNNLVGVIPLMIFNISTLQILALIGNSLTGDLPHDICHGLPNLKGLYLSSNGFHGEIPSSLAKCSQLKVLTSSYNRLSGSIPKEIGKIKTLQVLYLGFNDLTGPIPQELSNLEDLVELSLPHNFLTGSIPASIFNISSLRHINFAECSLSGKIPQEIANLYNLEELYLDRNSFSGSIPQKIFNISTLLTIAVFDNQLSGNLDQQISGFELPLLEELNLHRNNFRGRIPSSIANSSKVITIDLSSNNFTGIIPHFFGNLRLLERVALAGNNLINESPELSFITTFTNCRHLTDLSFADNPLSGVLPVSVGNLSSSLHYIYGYSCGLQGRIPSEIGNLSSLVLLALWGNRLTGSIPTSFANLQKLQLLDLSWNRISGSMIDVPCELHNLFQLYLSQNLITGKIPECLGNVTALRSLYADDNRLTSSIPTSLWLLKDLLELNLSSNFLSGSLPKEIGNLKVATLIDLSVNQFLGSIPTTVGDLSGMIDLTLKHNKLQGSIPESIGKVLNLEQLDLSCNNLSGNIPKSLEALRYLTYFNVSYNDLSGRVPSGGPFRNFSSQSFMFNKGLCGDQVKGLPRCHIAGVGWQKSKKVIVGVLVAFLGIVTVMALAYLVVRNQRKNLMEVLEVSALGGIPRVSYYELMQATEGYNKRNLLGSGSCGSVYRGTLNNGKDVAVKVFNLQLQNAFRSFDIECEVLRNLRHRNLCKVISTCSNPDFKALVLEYMPNGNLDKWLYSHNCFLDTLQRTNIMIEVACALEYLHCGYAIPIVHCDLKPSNVLLDEEMIAHLSDFGIAKLLGEEESNAHTKTLGTLGYIAPEYGLEGSVSIKCDVYSYGIMSMEVFTRTKPNSGRFSGDLSLRSWIIDSMPHAITKVIDSNLLSHEEQCETEKLKCISSIMELALNCSMKSANERLNMKDVVVALKKIRAHLLA